MLQRFRPRLLDCLPGYRAADLAADAGAGITVGLVALPLAMAFAIGSGVKPEAGIFTAIIAGFIIAALGGSKVQIGGPAGAFIVIIYGIIQQYGLANLLLSTMMAGILMFLMGLTGLGNLIRFIPVAIVIGFTNGIAVLIGIAQIKDFLGLPITTMPAEFFAQSRLIAQHLPDFSLPTLALSSACLLLIVLWPKSFSAQRSRWLRLLSRLPGTIVALVLATLAARLLELPVETIGSRFGGIPQSLPAMAWPEFHWASARNLVAPTITIALLGAIESLLCARVADSMMHDRHNPNQELMAQGLANLLTPLLGGIPATGTIARTTTNVRCGARTPIAGIIHCLTLLAVVLIAAPLAADVPLAALAAILVYVAWNMGEWRAFPRLAHFSNHYRLVMLSTFFLTVVFDLTIAVEVGMVLASLLFIYRVSDLTRLEPLALDPAQQGLPQRRVVAYSLFGSLFFGAVGKLELLMQDKHDQVAVVVLEMHQMINLDSTGLDTLETLHHSLHAEGRHLVLAGLNPQPLSLLRRSGFDKTLGEDKLAPDLAHALVRANQLARN